MSRASKHERTTLGRREFVIGAAGLGLAAVAGGLSACAAPGRAVDDPAPQAAGVQEPQAAASEPEPEEGSAEPAASNAGAPRVYLTRDISPAGLERAFDALGVSPHGRVAVKLSTGEPGGHNFLAPDLIAPLVQRLGGTIVECNTAYGGARSTTESHLQAAADHGFTAIAEVDIMDADGSVSLPVAGGSHLTEDLVGAHFENYDWFLSLAHFKGMRWAGSAVPSRTALSASPRAKGRCSSTAQAPPRRAGEALLRMTFWNRWRKLPRRCPTAWRAASAT